MRLPALLLALVATASPAVAAADAGEARLRSFLADVQAMDGRFRQQVIDSRQRVIEDTSGSVAMQRPGRFRWNYEAPFERVIVSDGEKIWLYEADLAQVTIRRLSAGIGDTPAALLTGRESVLERFRVEKSWMDEGLALVRLVPRSADSDFAAVTLGFDGPALRRLLLDDRLGQQTRIDLTDVRVNPQLAPDLFRFRAPPGADVIDESEL
ncbi:MAG: outer membrane lipoprotein chaperone LolA [Gemmatimonadota bacterium]|nr:outer membrane lipoprotein chaperone LolA [Gemmatimonadota bacterium]MDH5256234.1 outer membrane lipoprotein chaperone LolA [Gammaproteobacteria bacterium]